MLNASLSILRSRSNLQVMQRSFAQAASCLPPASPYIPMDMQFPLKESCGYRQHQQPWVDCPQPVVVKHPQAAGTIPFVKRTAKPKTASKCATLRGCENHQRQHCTFRPLPTCERILPPCRAFSELLDFKVPSGYSECNSGEVLHPLRFGFKKPCAQ